MRNSNIDTEYRSGKCVGTQIGGFWSQAWRHTQTSSELLWCGEREETLFWTYIRLRDSSRLNFLYVIIFGFIISSQYLLLNAMSCMFQWNSRGYDIAKIFHKKFTHVSPVWLQIKVKSDGYQITGTHDIDKGWVKEVIRGGKNSMG